MIRTCVDACDTTILRAPVNGLLYNVSDRDSRVPIGEGILFGCETGFYPRELMISTCQDNGMWDPDPSEVHCQSECMHLYSSLQYLNARPTCN